jgi:multiple sugar transport system permease protein
MGRRQERGDLINGLLFTAPIILGLLGFTAYPIAASVYYSFTDYSILRPGSWVGLDNYVGLFTDDRHMWISLYNTAYYVVFAVPLGILFAFALASLLNTKIHGLAAYRTIYYLPSILPVAATSILWVWIFNPQYGVLNTLLAYAGIVGPGWLIDPTWSKPSLILMSLWDVGGTMVIFLAGLQGIPTELVEAAELDGAGRASKLLHITVPFMSPYLLFALVTGLIGSFQYFTQAYVMTNGGPVESTRLYTMYLYENAFQFHKMGYASAMAWILFLIIVAASFLTFRTAARRVYYGGS